MREVKEVNATEKLQNSEGLRKAIRNHKGFIKPSFGGVWKGITYGSIVVMGVTIFGATQSYLLALWPTLFSALFFYLTHGYNEIFVKLYNQNEAEKVTIEYTINNIEEVIGPLASQDTDSIEDLDGTKGDE